MPRLAGSFAFLRELRMGVVPKTPEMTCNKTRGNMREREQPIRDGSFRCSDHDLGGVLSRGVLVGIFTPWLAEAWPQFMQFMCFVVIEDY